VGLLISSYAQTVLALAKGFLFIPLYLRHFDLATYGGYLASANVVGLLGVLDVGISNAFYQRLAFAHGRGQRQEFARLAGAGFTVLGVMALMIGAIGWSISGFVPGWINASPASAEAIAKTFSFTVVGSALMILNQGILGVPAAWQLPSVNAASRIGAQLVEMAVVVIGLLAGWGVVALGVGALVGGILGVVVTLLLISWQWRLGHFPFPRPDRASFRWLLSVGLPTLLSRVMGQIVGNVEVTLVSLSAGPTLAAVYGITERTFRLVQGFINPIVGSAFSGLAHLMGERGPSALREPLRELRSLFTLVVTVIVPSLLVVNQDFVSLWVGREKYGGTLLSMALSLNALFSVQVFFLSMVATAVGQVQRTAYLSTAEAVIRVPLMVVGLRILGPAGMALATPISGSFLAFLAYPVVIGRGLTLGPSAARSLSNSGLILALVGVLLGALAARYIPSVAHWPLLAVKGSLAAMVLLAFTLIGDKGAKAQLYSFAGRVLGRFRS
jgi:O-antigen/teichoic acid export membrane protein